MSNQKKKKQRSENLSLVLLDISRGYSVVKAQNKDFYFKHFSISEMLSFDEFEEMEFEAAVQRGIQTEQQLIDKAIRRGYWSVKKEEEIKSMEWTINHSLKALNKMQDENQKRVFSKQIEDQRGKAATLKAQRKSICLYSAEELSSQKRYKKMVQDSFYYDKKLKEEIKEGQADFLFETLFKVFNKLSDRNTLLKTAFKTHFFDVYITQYRNPLALFESNFLELTIFQKNLISLANALYTKMKNVSIPDSIADDPIKIMDYVEPKNGEQPKVTHGLEDLKAKMKSRGGELKPEDLLT